MGDHLEITSLDANETDFAIETIGTSKVLEWLGFSAGQKARKVGDIWKIVGASLVEIDWAKAISLENISLNADLSLSMGNAVDFNGKEVKNDRVILKLNQKDYVYNADGFIKVADKYYRILKVNLDAENKYIESLEVSLTSIDGVKKSDSNDWSGAVYPGR